MKQLKIKSDDVVVVFRAPKRGSQFLSIFEEGNFLQDLNTVDRTLTVGISTADHWEGSTP